MGALSTEAGQVVTGAAARPQAPAYPGRFLAAVVGGLIGLLATYVLATGDGLAAAGIVVVGLAATWLIADFSRGAVALLAGSLIIPNGVSLYFGPSLPLLTFQRVIFLLLVLAAVIHAPTEYARSLFRAPGIVLVWGMIAAMAVATALSVQPAVSQREFFTERALGLPFYYAVTWLALRGRRTTSQALKAVGVVGLAIAAIAIVEAFTGRGVVAGLGLLPPEKLKNLGYDAVLDLRAGFPRVESVFQHPLILGSFLVAYVPLVVALRRNATSLLERWCWSVALGLGIVSLVLTWSRGAWVALLLAVLMLRGGGFRRWVLVTGGGVLFVVVWSQLGFLSISKLAYRWWLVSAVAKALTAHFGFGSGPGTFVKEVVVYVTGTGARVDTDAMAYSLTMAIEAGPIFTLLLWWFVLKMLRMAKTSGALAQRDGDADRVHVLDALRAGISANLLLSAISASLFGPTVGLFLVFMLVAMAARLGEQEAPTEA